MAVYVISDIHGRYEEFQELLMYAGIVLGKDALINLGDMVNRGPDSYRVVEWFRKKSEVYGNIISLYGNHEDILLGRYYGRVQDDVFYHKKIGGKATEESYAKDYGGNKEYPVEHINFIKRLPLYYVNNDYIFFHGGLDLTKSLNQQEFKDLIWDENKFYTKDTSIFKNTFVFGHTPTEYINQYYGTKGNEIWKKDNKICIDCTYSKSRKLLLYNITDDVEYYYSFAQKRCYTKKNGVVIC